jgi:hypothetical protein
MENSSSGATAVLEEIKSDVAGARNNLTTVKHIASQVGDQNMLLERMIGSLKSLEKTISKAMYVQELSDQEQNSTFEERVIEEQEIKETDSDV